MRSQLRHRAPALAALAACTALAAAVPAAAETVERTWEKSYRLGAGATVEVENVNGAVVVETWNRPEVRVRATKKVRATGEEAVAEAMERLRIVVREGERSLHVETRHGRTDEGFLSWLRSGHGSVSYHLTVPRGIRLVAETVNGGVTLRGVDGDIAASTTNGSIRVENARGRVEASTTNGSIHVAMRQVAADADLDFSTTNGSVTLALPAAVRTELSLRTTNGGISVDLPLDEVRERSRRRLDATVNGGGGSVRVQTTNGAIRVVES